jgi:hypothetical protein
VNTRAPVLTVLVGEKSSQIVMNRAMTGIALGTQLEHNSLDTTNARADEGHLPG